MTNICQFDCVEIGLAQTTSRLTELLFQTTLLQRLTKICRRSFSTVCLLPKVAAQVEACMLSISTSYAVFSIRSHNPNIVLQRRCVLLYDSFREENCDSLSNFWIFRATRGCFECKLPQVLSLLATRKKAENFMWGVAMIFSVLLTLNGWKIVSIAEFSGNENKLLFVESRIRKLFFVENRVRTICHFL